jgi:hypothetical protein
MNDVPDEALEQSEVIKGKSEGNDTNESDQPNKPELTVVLDEDLLEMDYYNPIVRLARILLDIARNPSENSGQK